VCVSSLARPHVMLGLFAARTFEVGEVVTTYGGSLRSALTARAEPPQLHTHTRKIPDSQFVRDGKKWSQQFFIGHPTTTLAASASGSGSGSRASVSVIGAALDSKQQKTPRSKTVQSLLPASSASAPAAEPVPARPADPQLLARFSAEMDLAPAARTRLQPTGDPYIVPSDVERAAFLHKICTTGIGYMANTGTSAQWNVAVHDVDPRKDKMGPKELFYVATKRILPFDEIISPYHWHKLLL
jgi:hypothetical protein